VSDPTEAFAPLQADCARCRALCCVGPAFAASADFAIDKPAGRPCPHLRPDARCGIHHDLRQKGFPGCVAYDCFGAGQHVVQVTFGGRPREPAMEAVLPVVRQLHELRWYLEDVLQRPTAGPVHPPARAARDAIARLDAAPADVLRAVDVAAQRAAVAPLLRRASALVRAAVARPRRGGRPSRNASLPGAALPGRDLVGADLGGCRLPGADLRVALLIGADLGGADLRATDLLGTDLRAADLRGADLTDALFLTRTQVQSAIGDGATRMSPHLPRPAHWT
jgi:Pentapeptide repeats (8 copies)